MSARRLALISVNVADLARATRFYCDALGFSVASQTTHDGEAFARLMGVDRARARVTTLALGAECLELVQFEGPGRPYPTDSSSADLWFQHFAIVVDDMDAAHGLLSATPGWTPISDPGPIVLPQSSGGVTAFKFRDPDGHPIELLKFPKGAAPEKWTDKMGSGPFLGIDHSAIAAADTGRSEAFYTGLLGLDVAARSLNRGTGQEQLDGVFNAIVEVTALELADSTGPHVELLCYRVPPTGRPIPVTTTANDIAATRLVIETDDLDDLVDRAQEKRVPFVSPGIVSRPDGTSQVLLLDPDRHLLVLTQGRATPA